MIQDFSDKLIRLIISVRPSHSTEASTDSEKRTQRTMTMDKEESSLRESTALKDHGELPMRKSFRGVIDETEEEIMVSFASLVLRSDEMLRMTMDGSSKFGEDFADDISSCYEDLEDYNNDDQDLGPPLVIPKFEPPVIEAPYSCYSIPSGMSSPPPTNKAIVAPASPAPKKNAPTSKSSGGSKGVPADNSKPKRPLSAYNLFFQLERERLIAGVDPEEPFTAEDVERIAIQRRELEQNPDRPKRKHRKSHGKISFAELARKIADKWKNLKPDAKDLLQERAAIEKTRYLRELEEWTKYNNTCSNGIYSPQATIKNDPMPPTPLTPTPTQKFMPSHFLPLPPRHKEGLIFHRQQYPESPMRQHQGHAFQRSRHSPAQYHQWMMYQQQQQQHGHYSSPYPQGYLEDSHHTFQQQQHPSVVTPSCSFDSSYDDHPHSSYDDHPHHFNSESFMDPNYGFSTHSVYDMMRDYDQGKQDRSSPTPTPTKFGNNIESDEVPRGILDEAYFTPI